MGKNTDKLFITHSEWSGADLHSAAGGKASNTNGSSQLTKKAAALPFWTCSISQQPIDRDCGVCDADGHVFDIKNIMPYILRQKLNPVTGAKLESPATLTKLKITTDGDDGGKYIDPVTFKEFQRLSEAVVIKVSGQVYFASTIKDMCLKPGNLVDLVTDEPFKRTDVIKLQGGVGVLRKSDEAIKREREEEKERQLARKRQRTKDDQNQEQEQTGAMSKSLTTHHMAASLTSTAVDLSTASKFQTIPLDQLLKPKRFEGPGYAIIETSLGDLNVELWSKYSPKAVYNFIKHAKNSYYNDTIFHRNIRNFMIQGGDPTGTGRGGESAFPGGQPFKDETNSPYKFSARGTLAMANKGKNTNTSQFFVTYAARAPHLDGKHTVFGQVVGGLPVLDALERTPVDSADRPTKKIKILSVRVLADPFEEADKEEAATAGAKAGDVDDSPWLKRAATQGSSSIGQYLKTSTAKPATPPAPAAASEESNWAARMKKKTSISKSAFSGW